MENVYYWIGFIAVWFSTLVVFIELSLRGLDIILKGTTTYKWIGLYVINRKEFKRWRKEVKKVTWPDKE